jgi:hypothetical protein
VNPDHLFQGTQKDNMDDMYHKNRGAHPKSLFTEYKCRITPKEIMNEINFMKKVINGEIKI